MMLADTDRASSADLTMASNPVADEKPGDRLAPLALLPAAAEKEDTNAVLSPTHNEFFLTRIAGAFLALPLAVPYVGMVNVATIIAFATYEEGEISPLARVFDICLPCSAFCVLFGPTVSFRRATGTGAGLGQLAALGAGKVKISQRSRRSLGRAHIWMCMLSPIWFMTGLLCLVTAFRVGTRSKLTGRIITVAYARAVFAAGLNFIIVPLTFFPWWHTLKSASVLVADAIAEAKQAIERCSPVSPEWESEVLPHVLRLCDETLPLLSRGYGAGVGVIFLGWWIAGAGWFAVFLENGTFGTAFYTVACTLIPLAISYDAAAASSDCDLLSDALNEKRKRGDPSDQAFEHGLSRIESILNNENTRQGLGFTVAHRVMDLKTLGNIMLGIAGVATTAVPILFSLRPSKVKVGTDTCSLSAPQVATIQGVMMGNETCSYNVTLNEILGM